MSDKKNDFGDKEALHYHAAGRPGKLEITATKSMATQRDLSLAYSPGVAAPVRAIAEHPNLAYDYTAKGNLVAIITNGTAILGLGNLGPLASKPVMEGKAVLFKRFADIDGIDLEVDTTDVDEFINCVKLLGPTFGGINLEDIKAPECFIIEQALREKMDIPVFHDDQHGTAIITGAGIINAIDLTDRDIKDVTVVVNGAGAAAIACTELIKAMGVPHHNVIMCDSKGVIYQGREEGMNQWKSAHAVETEHRSLEEALKGADVFLGLSVQGAVSQEMVKNMADKPIIFAMANPDPEITPEDVKAVRPDAIVATGRSDYPNQVNNVLGFPYIFRGALDVRASTINDEMKVAAALAIAELAREDVPDEVAAAYTGGHPKYGPDYIIPAPFDPRLISAISPAVAEAAIKSGVAKKPLIDMNAYRKELAARLNPTTGTLQMVYDQLGKDLKRVIFTEADEETVLRAALGFEQNGYGKAVLLGHEEPIRDHLERIGHDRTDKLEIHHGRNSDKSHQYAEFLFSKLQRDGYLFRDCLRLVRSDRNVFGACMLAFGDADAMVTGHTRHYAAALESITKVIDPLPDRKAMGLSIVVAEDRTIFVADTAINEMPTAEEMAEIAIHTADTVRHFGIEPRVAFMSYTNFGNPTGGILATTSREAVSVLDTKDVDFEYEGEMHAGVALNPEIMQSYPFCRLSGPANVLIMPGMHSAHISTKLLRELGGGTVIGPMLVGLTHSVQVIPMGSYASEIINLAALAAHNVNLLKK
ncbi:NADP-dependent malic enzyme [Paremcibacter congregatus]|uniref:NADP-dependent malic enzyme n=1 Tax=Paremcibacter congregatus TaxID=2043170 RepID=A0A2G4YUP3_9PROT|nr:NADP-dependent malic enzyme [Paremcibacter congregatus]PHZ85997.1 NADP-dependent malic enzyme [Paremcibacter congregatus]QDE26962.1 NADP-dependent malic enzyme [Paremcibacter congregatus]